MAPHPLLRGSLRVLNAFAGSELAERYGLHQPAKRWIARGTQLGAEWLQRAAERARSAVSQPDSGERAGPLFDLTPTESQELIRATMRRFAEESLRAAAEAADDALEPPAELLAQAAELGLLELAIPEAFGGAAEERSPITWALVAEELARGDLGLAYALMAPVSVASLLWDQGSEEQQRRWLPQLRAGGFVPAAAAMLEPRPGFDPNRLSTRARKRADGFHLRGNKSLVPLGRSARFFIVSADVRDAGPRLFVVERDRPGLEIRSEPAMGLRAADLTTLTLDVRVPPEAMLDGPAQSHRRAVDLGRIGWSAMAVGQCQAVLEYATEYCNQRVAFGEPITHRQAVAFTIADMAIEIEGMRLLCWRAASRAEGGRGFARSAHLAKVQCGDKAMKIGTDGVQMLGGAGFVREHPMERWYRHLRAVGLAEGGICA